MVDLEWYKRIMLNGHDIPEGITINHQDHRAEQYCIICNEMVDHAGLPFTKEKCKNHV